MKKGQKTADLAPSR